MPSTLKTRARVRAFTGGLAAVMAASLAACGGGASGGASDGKIQFASTGGAFQKAQISAWQKAFTQQHGTDFLNTGPPDGAKLKTMVDSGKVSWDVIDESPALSRQYCGKYLEPIDYTIVDKRLFPPGSATKCGVPAYTFGAFLLYNTKEYAKTPPTSTQDFFDLKKYPGKRIVPSLSALSSSNLLEFALLADGVPKDKLYPLDVDRALKKLDTIKSQLVIAENYGQIQQAMSGQHASMVLSLTARAALAIEAGAPYKIIWDHTFANADDLMVPKGAPNRDAAMKFIAFVAQRPQQIAFAKAATMYPSVPGVQVDYEKPSQRAVNIFAPENKKSVIYTNVDWWAKNHDATISKATKWSIG